MSMAFTFALDGEPHAVTVAARQPELVLDVDGVRHRVNESGASPGQWVTLSVDGRSYEVWRTWESDRIHLRINGRTFSVGYEDPIAAAQHQAGGDDLLRSDMPGVVVEVNCGIGDHVGVGDALMVIESMKMQINIIAHRDGVIQAINVGVNETFDKGAELVLLHPED